MARHSLALALLLVLPLLAGCLSDDEAPASVPAAVAQSAEDAGGRSGPAPAAPKDAYMVQADDAGAEVAAYPVPVATNAARAPVTLDLSGEFGPTDCRGLQFGDLEEALAAASRPGRFHDLSESLLVGDVFAYNVTFSFANAPENWAEIQLHFGLGSTLRAFEQSTRETPEVLVTYEGQGFRASEEDLAWIHLRCGASLMQRPIPYTLTVTLQFAEGAVPAEAPMLLPVPEGATRLVVRGVAVDPAEGVMSHFRLFAPDDTLVCECALSSADEAAVVELPGPGAYVLLVDHTSNGFVSVALDAPAEAEMEALGSEWVETVIFSLDGGPVDQTVDVVLDRVPLLMMAFAMPKDQAGVGKATDLVVTNVRGQPLHVAWPGHVTWYDPAMDGVAFLGFLPGEWAEEVDHHAFAQGVHQATLTSEEFRGDVLLVTRQYVR